MGRDRCRRRCIVRRPDRRCGRCHRSSRHDRQQRRGAGRETDRGHDRRRLRPRDERQCARRLQLLSCCGPPDGNPAVRRVDHQHRLDRGQCRRPSHGGLQRLEGRRARADASDRHRQRSSGRAVQCDQPRLDHDGPRRCRLRPRRQSCRGAGRGNGSASRRPHGHAGRHRRTRRVPRVGRRRLRDR